MRLRPVAAATGCLVAVTFAAARGAPARGAPVTVSTPMASPAGELPAGPRSNGTGVLPDGRFVTPVGKQIPVELQPLNEALSRDGRRLYVSDEGVDSDPPQDLVSDPANRRFVTVIDTRTGAKTRFRDDALQAGMAESPDGRTLYVSEGHTGAVGVWARTPDRDDTGAPGTYTKVAAIPLGGKSYPWGLTLSSKGDRLYVVGFEGDSLSVIDTAARRVIAQVPTGQYPYAVVVSPDDKRAFVSNWGLYNQNADKLNPTPDEGVAIPPVTIGGYNTTQSSSVWTYDLSADGVPKVAAETKVGFDLNGDDVIGGSTPSALALAPDAKTLAVTSSNDDLVELLDTTKLVSEPDNLVTKAHPARVIDMRAIPGGPTGAQPDALAWASDGKTLYVAEAGRNSVAVVDASRVRAAPANAILSPTTTAGSNRNAVRGRFPTAWYPTAVVVRGDRIYVANDNGLGSGPNTGLGPAPASPAKATDASSPAYIDNTLRGSVEVVDLPSVLAALPHLSAVSDGDNGLTATATGPGSPLGAGTVVPVGFGAGPSKVIKHVFLILKENRTYDQVFGDVAGTERDQAYTAFPKTVTPNAHALASTFSFGDNYYVTSQTSVDGHYAVDTGQVTEFLQKIIPSSYGGKFPVDHFQTSPEVLPQGGFIWDNAGRHGISTRIDGEATYIVGIGPDQLGKGLDTSARGLLQPGITAANVTFNPLYSTQVPLYQSAPSFLQGPINAVYPYNDEGRVAAFTKDFVDLASVGVASQFTVMILFDDHTAGYLPGAKIPQDYVAENDHALGEVVSEITHSPIWKDSAIFVTEDDTQGGQDHTDAHRSFGLVISPWAKRDYVSHQHLSFASMTKTIDLLLGLPPNSLQELTATSMADDFVGPGQAPDVARLTTPLMPQVADAVNPTPAEATSPLLKLAARLGSVIPHGIDEGGWLLPADLVIGQEGVNAAGAPGAVSMPAVVEHTLPAGAPPAVDLPTAVPASLR